jgi:hypothetical protein
MPDCHDCQISIEETVGRWVILGGKEDGFDWIFICIHCVRDWRKRGLERDCHSVKSAIEILDKEYAL